MRSTHVSSNGTSPATFALKIFSEYGKPSTALIVILVLIPRFSAWDPGLTLCTHPVLKSRSMPMGPGSQTVNCRRRFLAETSHRVSEQLLHDERLVDPELCSSGSCRLTSRSMYETLLWRAFELRGGVTICGSLVGETHAWHTLLALSPHTQHLRLSPTRM